MTNTQERKKNNGDNKKHLFGKLDAGLTRYIFKSVIINISKKKKRKKGSHVTEELVETMRTISHCI